MNLRRWLGLVGAVGLFACGVVGGGPHPDSSMSHDAGIDANRIDATAIDSGSCTPMPEVCNGRDDDCDLMIDEGTLCGTNSSCQGISGCWCDLGWDDCDAMAGCETDVRADEANCGGCGVLCTGGNRWRCVASGCRSRCDPAQCATYFGCPLLDPPVQCYGGTCGDACP